MKNFCVRHPWERLRRAACSRGFGVQSPSDYRFITETLRGVLPETVYGALPSDEVRAKFCRLVYLVCERFKPQRVANLTGCAEVEAFVRFARADCNVLRPTLEQFCAGQSAISPTDVLIVDAAKLSVSGSFQQPDSLNFDSSSPLNFSPSKPLQFPASFIFSTNDLFKNSASPSRIIVANIHASKAAYRTWRELTKHAAATVSFDLYSSGVLLVDEKRWRAEYALWF